MANFRTIIAGGLYVFARQTVMLPNGTVPMEIILARESHFMADDVIIQGCGPQPTYSTTHIFICEWGINIESCASKNWIRLGRV